MPKFRKSPTTNPKKLRVEKPNQIPEKPRLGRPPLPDGERKVYYRQSIGLTKDQWENLLELAEVLEVKSRSGPNRGLPGWRTLIAILAEKAPEIIEQKRRKQTTYRPVLIFPGVSIILHPEVPNPNRIKDDPEST